MNRTARPLIRIILALLVASPAVPIHAQAPTASPQAPADQSHSLVVTADFNQDGIADTARVSAPAGDPSGPRLLTVSLGRGDGRYRQVSSTPLPGHDPQAIVVGDFNGDGVSDVIVGDGDGSLTEFLGDGKGNLLPGAAIAPLGSVVSIAVGDFNRDGILDLAVSDSSANKVTILLGSGKGAFQNDWSFSLPMQGKDYLLASADFNGDGIPDLAVTEKDADDDSFEVLTGNGNGTFTDAPALSHLRDPNAHCIT
jgi:hypothetical protein